MIQFRIISNCVILAFQAMRGIGVSVVFIIIICNMNIQCVRKRMNHLDTSVCRFDATFFI